MESTRSATMTAEEFWEWCNRPENAGKRAELVRGEVVEMPPPGEVHGSLCWWIGGLLTLYILKRGKGRATANDAGLVVAEKPDSVRAPDLAFFDESRPLDQLNWKHSRQVPQLVIEVLSPNDKPGRVIRRIGEYLSRGIHLVWVVSPEDRTVSVHRRAELPRTFDEGEELTGEEVLPDLKIAVADLFNLPGTSPKS